MIPSWLTMRLAGYGLAALAVGLLAWRIHAWRRAYQALPAAREALAASESARATERSQWAAESTRIATVSKGYLDELEKLRTARQSVPARAVRLCSSPAQARSDTPAPAATAGVDVSPAASGELPAAAGSDHPAGPDIGPDLYALADEADSVVASCRSLQEYVRTLP